LRLLKVIATDLGPVAEAQLRTSAKKGLLHNKNKKISMQNLAIRYGSMMFAGFTLFFLLMNAFGIASNTNLRIFNFVIHIAFIYLAIKSYRETHRDTFQNYAKGLVLGMYTSAIGVLGFTVFFSLYLSINPTLMLDFKQSLPLSKYLNPFTLSIFVLVEGTAVSLIASYILSRVVGLQLSNSK
jgi:hypothetical protein